MPRRRRCVAHLGIATSDTRAQRRASTTKQWEAAKAEGRNSLGPMRPEGRQNIIEAARQPKPIEQRLKMSEAHKTSQAERRVQEGLRLIAAKGSSLEPVFVERRDAGY